MQVTETLKDGLKRGYTITVPAAALEAKVQEKLVEAQPDVEIKGFRKGKVPLAILRKQFGARLMGDAMQDAIDGAMKGHFEATGDRPALQPEVKMVGGETWAEGQDVVVEMSYEALPEIPEFDASAIALEKLIVKADDKAVEEALKNLADSVKSYDDRKKGAKSKDGDQIVIDFKGSVDGEEFQGGSAEDYPLVLGSKSFIPGFEDQLTGAKVGDEVSVKVTFPENYGAQHLAGKEAVFACTVKAVKEPKAAEIDDEMAKKFGAEDLAALRTQVTARLEAEYTGAARAVLKRALLDKLDDMVKFELPSVLVDAEAAQIAHQLWHEEHPEEHGHGHGQIEATDEHKSLAERRVRLGLLLAEIDDELAKKFGAEDLAALKAQIAERLEAEYKGAARAVLKRSLLDQLDGMVKFDLPANLVEAEANQIAHQLWHEENPHEHGHNHGNIEATDEHKKLAERRVRLGLLLAEIGRKAEVTVTDAEMTQAVLSAARQYPGQERQYFEFVQKNPQVQQQLRAPIFEDKVVDLIVGQAKVTEKDVSTDELQKAVEALDEL